MYKFSVQGRPTVVGLRFWFILVVIYIIGAQCKKHVKSHSRITNIADTISFYCDRGNCRKSFSREGHLERHLKLHDNNLLRCYYCPWGGNQYSGFVIHLNHHFRLKPFQCTFCVSAFYQKQSLDRHEESFHDKILDRYKCKHCDFKTHHKICLFAHKEKKHKFRG